MTDKIELTREELKTMLHSATGNVKDFVMDNDNFIEGMIQAMNFSRCSTEFNCVEHRAWGKEKCREQCDACKEGYKDN